MDWQQSTGGPSIIISKDTVQFWSGVGSFSGAEKMEFEEADDFMDPSQCHYGQACNIEEEIGVIDWLYDNSAVLVIADQPSLMTLLQDPDEGTSYVVKWIYGNSMEEFTQYLQLPSLRKLESWKKYYQLRYRSREYCLMDSSVPGFDREDEPILEFQLSPGNYEISTLSYEPDPETAMDLIRLKKLPGKA